MGYDRRMTEEEREQAVASEIYGEHGQQLSVSVIAQGVQIRYERGGVMMEFTIGLGVAAALGGQLVEAAKLAEPRETG